MNHYKYILIPIITLVICQLIKFTIESIYNKKLKWARLFNGSGGMPSSHTSFSTSLTILLALNLGTDSPIFAVSLIFTLIIAYDSMGLRMESGKQAVAINWIVDELFENDLKEELGHKPLEVIIGMLLGFTSAIIFNGIFV